MSTAFYLLTILLASTPVLAIADGTFAQHVIVFAAALIMAAAVTSPEAEFQEFAQLSKRFSLAMLFPILWMVLQAVPLPFASLVNPIWSTTAIALKEPSLPGHISLDPGSTLRSIIFYLTILSLVISTVIITKDRHRAETTLFALSVVTTFMSAEVLIGRLDAFAGMIPAAGTARGAPFAATAALAVMANTAVISRAIERQRKRSASQNLFSSPLFVGLISGLGGIIIALAAMRVLAQGNLFLATGLGFVVFVLIAAVRRLGLRSWPAAILFTVLLAIAAVVAWPHFQASSAIGLLGFVTAGTSADALVLAQRALSVTPLMGSGVGTFELLWRAYLDFGAKPILTAPSTAVSIAIEWGQPALLILAGFAAQLFFFTMRGAIRRGRDSFFASAGAAGILVVLCESFVDSSLLSPTVQIIVAVMTGLGLSQSTGRTSGLEE
ncbi:MAG: O-antigen ligase family protein [Bradyrhizobium sp.]